MIPDMTAIFTRKAGLATLSACCLILIFPFFDIEVLAWVALIPLFAAIQQQDVKNTFWLGWMTGVVYCLGTLYWITITMVRYGGLPFWLSVITLFILAIYLALYVGIFTLLLRFLQRYTTIPLLLSAPILWVGLEYLRSFFVLGFPWNSLGYSQYLTPYVTQIADITGVYGVSFLIVLVNAGLYTILLSNSSMLMKRRTAIVTCCCVGICVGYGVWRLSSSDIDQAAETTRAAVVQGNIDQGIKWDTEHRQKIFETYMRLSKETLNESPDMIIWPETAVPLAFNYDPSFRSRMVEFVRGLNTFILFGGLDFLKVPSAPRQYNSMNSAFLLSPKGELVGKYDKIHLVPFGEYVPFQPLLSFVEQITTAIGRVVPGDTHVVLPYQKAPISAVICFEAIFPNLVRKFVDRGAKLLVIITNDAWFGRSSASYQHFAMVTFRAIENRVAIARAANTGISGFIDPYGRILQQSDLFIEKTLIQTLPFRTTTTVYTRYGDIFARFCLMFSLFFVGYGIVQKNKK
ncbi:apolipoprotein N-acyltransferase [candidate division KSB3 bacterium]|uniref:Apolipoprotein N-acyltransferase n=1 Tax=candidate division KSB3 bacterium TaxID=2044937 RepID=A0A2G6KF17_9BACT|nr:MAG: apolipoprotein N-acyltransferase [candidate division KSB3 bacterium]